MVLQSPLLNSRDYEQGRHVPSPDSRLQRLLVHWQALRSDGVWCGADAVRRAICCIPMKPLRVFRQDALEGAYSFVQLGCGSVGGLV